MTFQLLVAAMHKNPIELAKEMRLQSDAIIVSQGEEYAYSEERYEGHIIRYFAMAERGVGLSRNTSLLRADADIALFADEDIVYDDGYVHKVLKEFEKHPKADVLLFNVKAMEGRRTYHNTSFGRVRWLNCGRFPTYSAAVRVGKVHKAGVTFSLLFGGGAPYSNGEDSLFLMNCLKKGLRIYKTPVSIGYERERESTWFKGFNRKFFFDRGVLYAHLYGPLAMLFGFRFVFTKRNVMCREIPWTRAFAILREGIKEGRK